MNKYCALALVGLLGFQPACGDDNDGGGGDAAHTLRGRVDRSQALTVSQGLNRRVNTGQADAIWAIPVGGELRMSLNRRTVLPLEEDGSFTFTPENDGIDYILALVNRAACSNGTARKDWTETDIDARYGCILGYVSIPDAEGSGSMVAIPTSSLTSDVDVGDVTSSSEEGDEAESDGTLQEVAPSFSIGLDGLKDLARVDNTLKALASVYANMSDDGSGWYELDPIYAFVAPNTLEGAVVAPTDPNDFLPSGWSMYWGSSVAVDELATNFGTPGYIEFIAPHHVDDEHGLRHYGPEDPMSNEFIVGGKTGDDFLGFISFGLWGAAEGNWKIRRDGNVVAKLDMSVSSPFPSRDGVLDLSRITTFVPSLEIMTSDNDVTGIRITLNAWGRTGYFDANEELAYRNFEMFGSNLAGDDSPGCATAQDFETNFDIVSPTEIVWYPEGPWVMGPGDATHCGLTAAGVGYNLFGGEYSFSVRQTLEPFVVTPQSSDELLLDPDNGVDGTYVAFSVYPPHDSLEWRNSDLWVELADIVTTPTAGLVSLGTGEDGVFHLRRQATSLVTFYLEYTGVGSPPASYSTTANLIVHDGRPGRSKKSVSYPVSWSNTATPAESADLSIDSYAVPSSYVHIGGQYELKAFGNISGLSAGDHFAFSPASVADWPADEYELVGARVVLVNPGGQDAVEFCVDSACTVRSSTAAQGLDFWAAADGDVDYRARYTFRWAGEGSGPAMSNMVFNASGATRVHAPASDNAAAPTLQSTFQTAQMSMAVSPTVVSLETAPPRVTYRAELTHSTAEGYYADRVTITLPAGATVIPRSSRWKLEALDESLSEPTVVGDTWEWPVGTFIFKDAKAEISFDVFLAATLGEQLATGQAWVGNTAVDITATLGDSVPAFATVTVNP